MLRATHLSVGVAAALAVLQPDNLFECLAVTGDRSSRFRDQRY